MLFQLNQPVFFTGLRFDYAASDAVDLKIIAANGWNNTIDDNTSKSFAAQLMLKPMDTLIFYVGGVVGPEQPDFAPPAGMATTGTSISGPDSHWRGLADLVIDYNPSSAVNFALNGDFDSEQSESWYGVNLEAKFVVADPFAIALRGEYFGDNHAAIIGTKNVESATLTLSYVAASHLTLMLDNRIDIAKDAIFASSSGSEKTMFTSTLGAIIATK